MYLLTVVMGLATCFSKSFFLCITVLNAPKSFEMFLVKFLALRIYAIVIGIFFLLLENVLFNTFLH